MTEKVLTGIRKGEISLIIAHQAVGRSYVFNDDVPVPTAEFFDITDDRPPLHRGVKRLVR